MARPCEYVITFKPFWTALRWFGTYPQRVTSSGRLVHSAFSLPSILSGILLILSSWRFYIGCLRRFEVFSELPQDDFALRVLNYQFTVYLLSQFMIPLNIFQMGRMSRYAASWHDFQPKLQRVCGKPMRHDKLRRTVKFTTMALCVGWPLAIVVLLGLAAEQASISFAEVLTYAYTTTVLAFANTNWRMHCAFWLHASTMFSEALEQSIRAEGLSRASLARFLSAWRELYELLGSGAEAVGLTTFSNISILTLTLVFCTYNTMYIVLNGFSALGLFLTGVGLLTGFTISRLFNAAHLVNEELGTRVKRILAAAPLIGAPRDALQELDTFRNTLASCPVRLYVLGYLPVNRASLSAVWATMITYLVVLVQFTVDS